jgi:hypothetical protein
LTFAVSSLIRLSRLFALMKSSLKSFRNGNLALSAAKSLLDMTYEEDGAGSLVGMEHEDSSIMMSRTSLIEDVSSSEVRADGIP